MSTFTETVARRLEGIRYFSPGVCAGCRDCGTETLEELPDGVDMPGDEGSFSWGSCESCGSGLGGQRYPAHGFIGEYLHHFEICTDCVQWHANGTEPEEDR